MSILKPKADTLISMARLVYSQSELSFLNVSFSVDLDANHVVVREHDDESSTSEVYEVITVAELVASFIGLTLPTDLDANDAVTTGHRLGNTGR